VAWTAGQYVERQLLAALARGLPGAYTVYHDVDWAGAHAGGERHGHAVIVVVNRTGDVLLIEVKAGAVEFGPNGIVNTSLGCTLVEVPDVQEPVGSQARGELEKLLERKVFLKLWVTVAPDWTNNPERVRELLTQDADAVS